MNYVGKTLVFLNLLLGVFFLSWAGAIYLNKIDWGSKDPRKYLDSERIPSEFDKRAVLLQEALKDRKRADDAVAAVHTQLARWQVQMPVNHRFYNEELARLESSEQPIDLQRVKIVKGVVAVDKDLRPILEGKVTFTDAANKTMDVNKSYVSYRVDLRKVLDDIDTTTAATKGLLEKQEDLTKRLNGTQDEAGKTIRPGLYKLLEHEFHTQQDLKSEMGYLRPLWVRELVDAQLLLERRQGLEARMKELKAAQAARPVAQR
jgi:hypothetical protein